MTKYFMKYGACRNPRDEKGVCKIAGMAGNYNNIKGEEKKTVLPKTVLALEGEPFVL